MVILLSYRPYGLLNTVLPDLSIIARTSGIRLKIYQPTLLTVAGMLSEWDNPSLEIYNIWADKMQDLSVCSYRIGGIVIRGE
jgi:hypothetical protein